jgi:hypothetical protein
MVLAIDHRFVDGAGQDEASQVYYAIAQLEEVCPASTCPIRSDDLEALLGFAERALKLEASPSAVDPLAGAARRLRHVLDRAPTISTAKEPLRASVLRSAAPPASQTSV